MGGHGAGVAENYEFHAGARYRHVHSSQVAQKTYLPLVVRPHERNEDDVALLPLKSIHGVHRYAPPERFQALALLHEAAQILHLRPVGRYYAHVDALVEQPLLAYLGEILLKGEQRKLGLSLVDAPEALAHKPLAVFLAGGGGLVAVGRGRNPLHRSVVVEYATVLHLGSRHHLAMVEPLARKAHYGVVHAVLHGEQRHHVGLVLHYALHQRAPQAHLHGLVALHRGRQLAVVAGEHHPADAPHGYPAGGLKGLGGLVDEQRAELHAVEQAVGAAHKCGGDHPRLAKQFAVDAHLQFGGARLQTLHLLVIVLAAALPPAAQLAHGLAYSPQLRVVGVGLEAPLIGGRQHLVVDLGGVAQPQHVDATVGELLGNPVYRHVALRAHQHLVLPAQSLVDGLDERGGLPRAGRPMHDGHVLGTQHLVDGPLLSLVQVGEVHGLDGELGRLLARVEKVAQVAQPPFALYGTVERTEHGAVARLVEKQLHAHLAVGSLKVD